MNFRKFGNNDKDIKLPLSHFLRIQNVKRTFKKLR